MGGCWLFVFASCLLVQSLSAEGSVKGNSTSAVKDNSTSAVTANSTSAVKANSTSAVTANSSSAVKDNSTSAVTANSTSVVKDNSTSAVTANSTSAVKSDEELEKEIGQWIASRREMGQDDIHSFTDFALQHYNIQEASLFTPLKNTTVTVKKAIGSMVYLQMTLEKTNCTRKDMNPGRHFRTSRFPSAEKEEPPKYCGPLAGQDKEQLDCKFDIFKNERSYGDAVVSHDCKPVRVIDKSIFNDVKS